MRVGCLVDGFNLYHSICDAVDEGFKPNLKWLNLRLLAEAQLSAFNDKQAIISEIHYFTSLATYERDKSHVTRHKSYIRALQTEEVNVIYGVFKDKKVRCEAECHKEYIAHVEKQTDVNIALKLIEVFQSNSCDACLIVSGDGDLLNAAKTAKMLFPEKKVAVAFPHKRWNQELSNNVDIRIKLTPGQYLKWVFPSNLVKNEKTIRIPKEWESPET